MDKATPYFPVCFFEVHTTYSAFTTMGCNTLFSRLMITLIPIDYNLFLRTFEYRFRIGYFIEIALVRLKHIKNIIQKISK